MIEYSIHPMVVGINETDQGIMTYLRDYGKRILIPIYMFIIRGCDKNIVVDTGLEQIVVSDEIRKKCSFEILEFEAALAKFDLKPEDINIIIHTHLHNDHCENDYKCVNAQVYVQAKEFAFFQNPHPIDHRYYSDILDNVNVIELDGDASIYDGIDVIFTPGHTVGGQSISIHTSKGKAVITGFCCNEKNFPKKGPVVAPGVHIDVIEAYESVKKIKEMADILIPLHDFSIGEKPVIP